MLKALIYKYGYITILIISMLVFVSFFYGKVIVAPNQILFNATGDGLKNYYVPMMQVGSDQYFNFEYFNYPYGEHFLYTDGFPVLIMLCKPIAVIFPEISSYIPAIINISILLSIVFCAIFIYLILKKLSVPEFLSIIFAIGISSLQPQMFRITGHFSLAFCHIIPLSFWLVLMFLQSDKKIKWSIFILLHNISAILFHPYLGIMSVFSTLPVLVVWGFNRKLFFYFKWYFFIFIQTFLPLLFYKTIILLTDHVFDRNTHPQGFHENTADFASVFTPLYGPFSKFFHFQSNQMSHNWEGVSYIGLASTILLIPLFAIFLIRILRKKEITNHSIFFVGILFSALIFLFLSMSYPFVGKYYNAYQKIVFLREFRAVGRFAWVFYYSSTLFVAYGIWTFFNGWIKTKMHLYILFFIISFVPLSYAFESFSNHKNIGEQITQSKNCFLKQNIADDVSNALKSVKPNYYQAILPIPYYYVGTEIFDVFGTEKSQQNSIFVSQQTLLPLLTNYSARSSFDISRKMIRIMSSSLVYKDITSDIPNHKKPFLIVCSDGNLNLYEKDILNKSKFIAKSSLFSMYEITFDDLFNTHVIEFPKNNEQYPTKLNWQSQDTSQIIFANNFNDVSSEFSFEGKGAYKGICKFYHILYEFPFGELKTDSLYSVSFWIYNYNSPHVFSDQKLIAFINKFDTITKTTTWNNEFYPIKSTLSYGSWSLINMPFTIPDNHSNYSIVLKGNDSNVTNVYIDNLLVVKNGASTYKNLNDSIFLWNNYVQKKSGKPFIYK